MAHLRIILPSGLLLAFLAVAPGVRAAAEEKKSGNDVITATRRDLEALKTDRTLTSEPRPALSGLEAPAMEMPSSVPMPMPDPQQKKSSPDAGKSANWLIDAMKKSAPRSPADRNRDRMDKSEDELKSDDDLFGDAKETADRTTASQEPARRDDPGDSPAVKTAPNPLTGFMAAWMTPRDFNLLLKPEETGPGAAPAGTADMPGQAFFGPGPTGMITVPTDVAALGGNATRPNDPAGSPTNPYLQAMTLPTLPNPGAIELTLPAPPPVTPRPTVPPPQAAPEPPAYFRPEIQKRDDDAKYFPQLKRF
jgi:hypothetical protein